MSNPLSADSLYMGPELVITVPADDLEPSGVRPLAGTVVAI